jgi:hypothetical protein
LSNDSAKAGRLGFTLIKERLGMIKAIFYIFMKNQIAYLQNPNLSLTVYHQSKAQTLSFRRIIGQMN